MVGFSNILFKGTDTWRSLCIFSTTMAAFSECPPKLKKSAWILILSLGMASTPDHISANVFCNGVAGAV